MTMDIQKNYQNYNETSAEGKDCNLKIESAKTSVCVKEMKSTNINQAKSSKRSFDVAFLMMPDEKIRQKYPEKHLRVSKQLFNNVEWDPSIKHSLDCQTNEYSNEEIKDHSNEKYFNDRNRILNNVSPNFGSDGNIDVGTEEYSNKTVYCSDSEASDRSRSRPNSNESAIIRPRFLPETPYKSKIFDDPGLSTPPRGRFDSRFLEKPTETSPKSAFTKVVNYAMQSPNPSVSPDNLIYQNSVSPPLSAGSPPTTSLNKITFNNLLSPVHLLNSEHFFKGQNMPSNSSNYYEQAAFQSRPGFRRVDCRQEKPPESKSHHLPNKMNFLPFRGEMPPYLPTGSAYPFGIQNFQSPNSDFLKLPMPQRESGNSMIVNPAAAILSTLLPPTLAAFSMPAQNICAKCNISFRMTSDLVYHMRTHHKSETVADPNRRKREEKLKCPVCNESFRERHHLTRHMTAHQDKEGDMDDIPSQSLKKSKHFYSQNGTSMVQK